MTCSRKMRDDWRDGDGNRWSIKCVYTPGVPEVPMTLDDPGLPAEGPFVEDIEVLYEGEWEHAEDIFTPAEVEKMAEFLCRMEDD